MVRQVLYVSKATQAMRDDELIALLEECRIANAAHGITGSLIYLSGFFIQIVEGPKDQIEQLAHNISLDSRNTNFSVLSDEEVAERSFPSWNMGFRTMSIEELRKHPGFLDINDAIGLDYIKEKHAETYSIMLAYYKSL